jgi:hypothetical protein
MTPRDPDPYTRYTLPSTRQAQTRTAAAIAIYRAYRLDPFFMRPPSTDEVRLIAEFCQEWINSSAFTCLDEERAWLRHEVKYIRTIDDLARWLWDCRRIMRLEPL